MKFIFCKDDSAWVEAINLWIKDHTINHGSSSLYIPAGETPRPLYRNWEEQRPEFLNHLKFLQLDEVVRPRGGIFKEFFQSTLPSFQNQIDYIDDAGVVADLALLGLGTNGHVAFHEPDIDAAFFSGCVRLSSETCSRLNIAPHSWGQTYGLGAILRSKAVALIVRGQKKRDVLKSVIDCNRSFPASALMQHKNLTIFSDFDLN